LTDFIAGLVKLSDSRDQWRGATSKDDFLQIIDGHLV